MAGHFPEWPAGFTGICNYSKAISFAKQALPFEQLYVNSCMLLFLSEFALGNYLQGYIWLTRGLEAYEETHKNIITRTLIEIKDFTPRNKLEYSLKLFFSFFFYKKIEHIEYKTKCIDKLIKENLKDELLSVINKFNLSNNVSSEGFYYLSCFFSLMKQQHLAIQSLERAGKGRITTEMLINKDDDLRNIKLEINNYILSLFDKTEVIIQKKGLNVHRVEYSNDCNFFAVINSASIELYNIKGKLLKIFSKDTRMINSIAFSPDGKLIASHSQDGIIRIWTIDGNELITIPNNDYYGNVVSFSPDSKQIAFLEKNKTVIYSINGEYIRNTDYIFFDTKGNYFKENRNKTYINNIWNNNSQEIVGIDKQKIIAVSNDLKKIIIRMTPSIVTFSTAEGKVMKFIDYGKNKINSLLLSPDENMYIVSYSDIHLRSCIDNKTIDGVLISTISSLYNTDFSRTAYFVDSNKFVMTGSNFDYGYGLQSSTIKLWDTNGKLLNVLNPVSKSKYNRIISFDTKFNAELNDAKNMVIIRDNDDHIKCILYDQNIYSISLRYDNHYIATLSGKTSTAETKKIVIWDINGRKISEFSIENNIIPTLLQFHPNKKIIAITNNVIRGSIIFYDFNGKLLGRFDGKNKKLDNNEIPSFAFSPDGSEIAIAQMNNIHILNLDGTYIRSLRGHNFWIFSVRYSPDGKFILSSALDSTAKLWNLEMGTNVTFVAYNNEMDSTGLVNSSLSQIGIVYCDDGFYKISGEGINSITFVKGPKVYSFDQFDLRYNRPDVIIERLINEKGRTFDQKEKIARFKKYWELRVVQNGFTPDKIYATTKIHAPHVFDIKLNDQDINKINTSVKNNIIKLSFKIKDEEGSNLDVVGYKILVNGVPIHGQNIKHFNKSAAIQSVTETVTLSSISDVNSNSGDNKIEISGFTNDGVESHREEIYLHYEGSDNQKKRKLYIVSIGVKDYENAKGFPSLSYADKDAEDIVNIFTTSGKSLYSDIISKVYLNNAFTRKSIIEIQRLLKQTTVDDTVIFFMSGHGVRADTRSEDINSIAKELGITQLNELQINTTDLNNIFYFITGDSDNSEPWKKAVPMDFIRYTLDGIPARQKILMIDSCQSGENPLLIGYKPSKEILDKIREKKKKMAETSSQKGGIKAIRKGNPELEEEKIITAQAVGLEMMEMSEMFPELRRGSGTIEISAASGIQWAVERDRWANGAFTYAVKEAMKEGKTKSKGGKITVKFLRSYVLGKVMELTEEEQTPMVCRDIPGRDFVVGE